ncbi:hypothetical protein [Desulfatiglans anilini]|uniref:hypothetical protein n=1 Tax=Desulfatiglans anilini TaxID=90728 RepID=UPI00042A60D1|nr:hypothetical protein [Desulfatiglans anilini]
MSKNPKSLDKQLSIFDLVKDLSTRPRGAGGALNAANQLRDAMRQAIKSCPLSRHQIAGEMSHHAGETITKEMIDSWTREPDEGDGRSRRYVPAEYLPAFCRVTGDMGPLTIMCQMVGMFVLPGPEALRAEIQKLDEEINRIRDRKRKRLTLLREIEP